ncbi:MAG TPA: type III pantothenate kinase [Lachnospiraceae bacterium]|nr:type III pantothenate kinase [Lachnospiraceae bacterium]
MLLTIDIGNTNLTFGVFEGEELRSTFRLTTNIPRTSNEFGEAIVEGLSRQRIPEGTIDDVIIASVVPKVMYSLVSGIKKYFHCTPYVVGEGTKSGIHIAAANPSEIGADRIVDAVGAYDLYGGPVIVVDYGTATTYDLVTKDGVFAARVTCPGIKISTKALWSSTAQLPEIEIKMPDTILAKNTITSMQAGIMYGTVGQTEYIIRKIKEESGISDIKVVATGGLGRIVADATDSIDVYDAHLTLQGIRLIYEKTKAARQKG